MSGNLNDTRKGETGGAGPISTLELCEDCATLYEAVYTVKAVKQLVPPGTFRCKSCNKVRSVGKVCELYPTMNRRDSS
jgi:hypothetical protein